MIMSNASWFEIARCRALNDTELKLQFAVLLCPILASVIFLQRPSAAAGFRDCRLRIYCSIQTTCHVGGGPGAKVPGPLLA